MKSIFFAIPIAGLLGGCAMNMVTGRNQLSLAQESEFQWIATGQYKTFLTENKA